MKTRIENHPIYVSLTMFLILTYIFCSFAFIIPKWFEKWQSSQSQFQNIGLWEICFDGYMSEDVYEKIYMGCFYINSGFISELKNWIFTSTFKATQALYTISYLVTMIATFYAILMGMGTISLVKRRNGFILLGLLLVSWFFNLTTLIVFGRYVHFLKDGDWMPFPKRCSLSWSYGSAALGLLGTMICIGHLLFALFAGQMLSGRVTYLRWSCSSATYRLLQNSASPNSNNNDNNNKAVSGFEMPVQSGNMQSRYDPRGGSSVDEEEMSRLTDRHVPSIMSSGFPDSEIRDPKTDSRMENSIPSSNFNTKPRMYDKKQRPDHHGSQSTLRASPNPISPVPCSQLTTASSASKLSNNKPSNKGRQSPEPLTSSVMMAKPMKRK